MSDLLRAVLVSLLSRLLLRLRGRLPGCSLLDRLFRLDP